MHSRKNDRELLALLQVRGEREEAFRALAERHTPRLLGFLRTYFHDRATAEDIVQQVFLALFQDPPREASDSLEPWFLQAVRNRALHEKRRQRTRPTVSEVPDRGAESGERGDETDRLKQAILSLPENYREVLVLHRFKGLSYDRIAPLVGTTPGSARVMMHKALELLRKRIGGSR